jgi:hypothetical protein
MPETIFRLHKNSYWSCPPCSASNIILLPPLLQTLTTLDVTSTPPQESLDTPSLEHSTNLEDYELLKSANGLKICHLNVNSVRNKFHDIVSLLIDCNIDVLALTESKLNPNRDLDSQFLIDGYNFSRFDRDYNNGGGTVIYIKQSICVDFLDNPFQMYIDSEYVIFKLSFKNSSPIHLCCVYSHPKTCKTKLLDFFKQLNSFLCSFGSEYLIFGDFNFDLLKKSSDTFKLYHYCKEFSLRQLINEPTFDGKSLLDHFYVNRYYNIQFSSHFPYAGSNHDLIFVVRKLNKIKVDPILVTYRTYKNVNFELLSEGIDQFYFDNCSEINQQFLLFNHFVLTELDKQAPLKKRLVKGKLNSWYTSELNSLRKKRDGLQKIAHKSQSTLDVKSFRIARNYYNCMVSSVKKKFFYNQFQVSDSKSLWDSVNKLTGFRKKQKNPISKLFDPSTNCNTDVKSRISELLVNEFVVDGTDMLNELDLDIEIEQYEKSYIPTPDTAPFSKIVFAAELDTALSETKRDCKIDWLVPLKLLKTCKVSFSKQLSTLFTLIFTTISIPQCFKAAKITPLYKGRGKKLLASNYRPISGLNVYCKIFERLLFNRLRTRLEAKLCSQQHGFRKNRSCHTAIAEFTNYIYSALDRPAGKCVAVFYDAKKAFNSIDRTLLLKKLMYEYNLDPEYIKLFKKYLSEQVIKVNDEGKYYVNPVGVAQGGSISPLLFSLFINDISEIMTTLFLLYADDLVIYESGDNYEEIFEKLKLQMLAINNWCVKNKLKINYDKTQFLIFHKPRDIIPESISKLIIEIDNNVIKQTKSYKYLGVRFDSVLSFKEQLDHVTLKTSNALSYLYGIKRYLSEKVMLTMLNSHVNSISDYCIDLWAIHSDILLNVIQGKVDRFLTSYYFPILAKKSKKKARYQKPKLNLNFIRKNCNLLTICERRDLYLLKYAYLAVKQNRLQIINTCRRSWPTLNVTSHKTKLYENCINYRAVQIWNKLPKDWNYKDMEYSSFVNMVKEWLTQKRNEEFVYY